MHFSLGRFNSDYKYIEYLRIDNLSSDNKAQFRYYHKSNILIYNEKEYKTTLDDFSLCFFIGSEKEVNIFNMISILTEDKKYKHNFINFSNTSNLIDYCKYDINFDLLSLDVSDIYNQKINNWLLRLNTYTDIINKNIYYLDFLYQISTFKNNKNRNMEYN